MNIRTLTIGMKVRHPQYGVGTIKSISEQMAEIRFDDGNRTVAPEVSGMTPAEPQVAITELEMPLSTLLEEAARKALEQVQAEPPAIQELGARWHGGKMVLHPADPTLSTKEIPLETFFHKVVGVRNQLRVLEQKLNAHPQLSDGEKVEMQQYITRSYGAMTTFNLLFKTKDQQFNSKGD